MSVVTRSLTTSDDTGPARGRHHVRGVSSNDWRTLTAERERWAASGARVRRGRLIHAPAVAARTTRRLRRRCRWRASLFVKTTKILAVYTRQRVPESNAAFREFFEREWHKTSDDNISVNGRLILLQVHDLLVCGSQKFKQSPDGSNVISDNYKS